LLPSDEVDSPAGFAAWIARLAAASDQVIPVAAGQVRCTYRWIVEGKQVLGGIALRHTGNDAVRWWASWAAPSSSCWEAVPVLWWG